MTLSKILSVLVALAVVSGPALAATASPLRGDIWMMWPISPMVTGGCLLALAIYFRGFLRRRNADASGTGQAISFTLGIGLTYIVLQSPMAVLSDHIFWVHRVQHVALHHWIPMLLVLAAPAPELIQGLPVGLRRWLLEPLLCNRGVRTSYAFIQHPVIAPLLFVGLIYFWLNPTVFHLAMGHKYLHEAMHYSMLVEGIPFWWLMLNPRPDRVPYLGRIVILWAIMLPQIAIGAYITFSHHILYPVYITLDQGWVSSYPSDQQLGGLIVWIPASMMSVIAALIVCRFWWLRSRRFGVAAQREPLSAKSRQKAAF